MSQSFCQIASVWVRRVADADALVARFGVAEGVVLRRVWNATACSASSLGTRPVAALHLFRRAALARGTTAVRTDVVYGVATRPG